jgi:CSLREA domain-containing protein
MSATPPRLSLPALLFGILAAAAFTASTAGAVTFIVNSTGDEPDDNTADNLCHTAVNTCTLRAAIQQANATAGPDVIQFNIAGAGVHTIRPTSGGLPTILDPVTIDGYSQPGSSVNTLAVGDNAVLLIEIDGSNFAGTANGLTISTNACTIKGLVINRFTNPGIQIDATGGGPLGGHTVQGNFIGTTADGTAAAGNGGIGLFVRSPNNLVGGANPADRNVIAATGGSSNPFVANLWYEADFGATMTGNVAQGNYLGTNAAGTAALSSANGAFGVKVHSGTAGQGGVIIGGFSAGARNVIAGNAFFGVEIESSPCTVTTTNVIVEGNFIGVDANGAPLGNGLGGVHVGCGATNSMIGGTGAGAGNVIANNGAGSFTGSGVLVDGSQTIPSGNAILGNSILSNKKLTGGGVNAGLGIDLNGDGPTPNDACDADTGPNGVQNFPILTTALTAGGNTNIQGTLNSTASTTYRIEFFANDTCDPSGFGEGQTYLGFTTATTDASCHATFNMTLPVSVAPTTRLTATATDPGNNTSEFSSCISLTAQFHTIQPCRIADTRLAPGPYGGPPLNTNSDRSFLIAGQCGVPAAAQAVAFNFAIVAPTAGGNISVYPGGGALPVSATMNYSAGQIRANNGIVPLGPSGDVLVHLGQGAGTTTNLVIDINGYFQ